MSSNTILLITGANTGLGFETVKSLLRSSKSYTILLGGRSLEKANEAASKARSEYPDSTSTIETVQIDIEDDQSIQQLSDHVTKTYGRLDILINNAGGQFDRQAALGHMGTREMWLKSWNVNTVGTYIMTHTFVPLLLKSSDPRLIFIASGTSTLAESENPAVFVNKPPAAGWPKAMTGVPAYRSAKTGMNMMMREWVRMLKEDGVKAWGVSPGFLATGLGGDQAANKANGAIDPTIGANFVRDVVEGVRDKDAGRVIRKDDVQPW